jgi:hypothetical protein
MTTNLRGAVQLAAFDLCPDLGRGHRPAGVGEDGFGGFSKGHWGGSWIRFTWAKP